MLTNICDGKWTESRLLWWKEGEREREQKLREEKKHIWIVRKQLFVIWNMIDEMFCGIVLNGWRMANKITFKMWPIVHLKILILLFKSFLTICHTCNRRSTQKDEPSLWNKPKTVRWYIRDAHRKMMCAHKEFRRIRLFRRAGTAVRNIKYI